MDIWYGTGPLGIPGDDDGGATSSWYVLSAMGFYPVCPGSPVYEIGSPIFAKTTIRMGNGKDFTIIADHVSARNKYIESAKLNGKPLDKPWFRHADIAGGGTLALEMGDTPNTSWGTSPQDAPPSMSSSSANKRKRHQVVPAHGRVLSGLSINRERRRLSECAPFQRRTIEK